MVVVVVGGVVVPPPRTYDAHTMDAHQRCVVHLSTCRNLLGTCLWYDRIRKIHLYPDPSISGRFTGGNQLLFTARSGGYPPAKGACQGAYGLPSIGIARETRVWARYLESEI